MMLQEFGIIEIAQSEKSVANEDVQCHSGGDRLNEREKKQNRLHECGMNHNFHFGTEERAKLQQWTYRVMIGKRSFVMTQTLLCVCAHHYICIYV